ncbi:MAG: AAA family ATPase, partial [Clostridia bacterium]|nr:AAA family ATPase [Clostridia bacterium]
MGTYFNPGNDNFRHYIFDDIYVDKTGLITVTNSCVFKSRKYICVTRPRRFGKSYAADMLTAYYSRGCKSRKLFKGSLISKNATYKKHLNKYNVIHIDVSSYMKSCSRDASISSVLDDLIAMLMSEIRAEYPNIEPDSAGKFPDYLDTLYRATNIPFVFIIDEWDAFFRNRKDDLAGQKEFMDRVEALLKGKSYVALAYMTGILPIKKYATGSALNMFS